MRNNYRQREFRFLRCGSWSAQKAAPGEIEGFYHGQALGFGLNNDPLLSSLGHIWYNNIHKIRGTHRERGLHWGYDACYGHDRYQIFVLYVRGYKISDDKLYYYRKQYQRVLKRRRGLGVGKGPGEEFRKDKLRERRECVRQEYNQISCVLQEGGNSPQYIYKNPHSDTRYESSPSPLTSND